MSEKQIEVETGIPVPTAMAHSKYPFEKMNVGDSFFAEGKTPGQIRAVATYWEKKLKAKYLSRTVDGGVRCWRFE